MKTTLKVKKNCCSNWYLIDASNMILGRLAAKIAYVIQGKHKVTYRSCINHGDFIIIVNCEKVKLTGRKESNKRYWSHTGYVGGIKSMTVEKMRNLFPIRIIKKAVRGMLPKNALSRSVIKKLKIYKGQNHPHVAQKPLTILN